MWLHLLTRYISVATLIFVVGSRVQRNNENKSHAMNDREQRGMQIAALSRIDKKGGVYLVPSQTGYGKYTVCPDAEHPHCTCPDHETRGCKCKHIFAVEFVIQRELFPDGTETVTQTLTVTETVKRKTYPQQWKEYNAAQVNEKDEFKILLRNLCDQVPISDAPPRRGRPSIPMSDAIFMACFKVYSTVSGRRFMCDLDDAREEGFIRDTPHFNSIFNALENPELTPILTQLIELAATPLKEIESDFAVDSTGFTSSRFHGGRKGTPMIRRSKLDNLSIARQDMCTGE